MQRNHPLSIIEQLLAKKQAWGCFLSLDKVLRQKSSGEPSTGDKTEHFLSVFLGDLHHYGGKFIGRVIAETLLRLWRNQTSLLQCFPSAMKRFDLRC